MKIRLGFVSNSSSSSFCVFGITLTEEIRIIAKKYYEEHIGETSIAENYFSCPKCKFSSRKCIKKFCENCGSPIEQLSRLKPIKNYILFNGLLDDLRYIDECDAGSVIGFDVDGLTIEQLIDKNKKLIEIFGDLDFSFISGEESC